MPQKIAAKLLRQREQNRDRCVRLTWIMRRLVREQGRRLTAQGRIDALDELFHLTLGVLIDPPEGVRETIARRKAEREKLEQLHMPPIFAEKWQAAEVLKPLEAGEKLDGIGICGGKIVGRARIVEPHTIDDVEPGEVMIAHVTDIGYTALFGHVAAVVTDIGGVMSHAAVVAREFGVACVVDTQVAASRIPNGALVEVDGSAGTITVLELGIGRPSCAGVESGMSTPSTMTAAIRAVVFDWSGVLTESPLSGLRRYSNELGLPETALDRYIRGDEEISKVERGELSVRDYLKGVCVRVRAEHGVEIEIRRLGAAMADTRTLRQPMLDLVAELSEHYTLAVLTNNVAENREHLATTLPLNHFAFVLNSADVGVRKPDPLIYRELLRRLDCEASEVVYIDDFAENLPPAADLGMATIEFTDPENLRIRLAELGI